MENCGLTDSELDDGAAFQGINGALEDFLGRETVGAGAVNVFGAGAGGEPELFRRDIPDYVVPIDESEKNAYNELRIEAAHA